MKRIFLLSISALFLSAKAEQGFSIGLKFSPSMSFSRVSPSNFVDANGTSYVYSGDGIKGRFGVGVIMDYMIGDNYGISTGLNFLLNGSGYQISKTTAGATQSEANSYSIQYVQIPFLLKLQTSEVVDNFSFYAKMGAGLDYMVGARVRGEKKVQLLGSQEVIETTEYINNFHSSLIFSLGTEYKWKGDMILLLGVTYSRGITDVDNQNKNIESKKSNFDMSNDFISLDLGVKF
ncbi:MAG: PorT family protein [Cytophagales bacterium]|nr:MAG: PorT family protein [Cytophagales bacterium]